MQSGNVCLRMRTFQTTYRTRIYNTHFHFHLHVWYAPVQIFSASFYSSIQSVCIIEAKIQKKHTHRQTHPIKTTWKIFQIIIFTTLKLNIIAGIDHYLFLEGHYLNSNKNSCITIDCDFIVKIYPSNSRIHTLRGAACVCVYARMQISIDAPYGNGAKSEFKL